MKDNTLTRTNPHLKDTEKARRRRVRSLASSTAIETGESIRVLEVKLNQCYLECSRVSLAGPNHKPDPQG
ncbi:hypothetical protein [Imhoffiella purpurea]|uniref:hypothetical protein n=1 Tax=Imhoffiella purpurea TaxID=1249627 RepID=UPI0012FDB10B|nr:hypothetical protein [Imhoffiella purpurea]